jgi:hypothetical protein
METKMIKPIELIDALRNSDFYIECIFMQGSCYKFHVFLKTIWPQAIACINPEQDHIITLIDGEFYDITGIVENYETYRKLDKYDLKKVEKWDFAGNMLLKINECPYCEEELTYCPKTKQLYHVDKGEEPTDEQQQKLEI